MLSLNGQWANAVSAQNAAIDTVKGFVLSQLQTPVLDIRLTCLPFMLTTDKSAGSKQNTLDVKEA